MLLPLSLEISGLGIHEHVHTPEALLLLQAQVALFLALILYRAPGTLNNNTMFIYKFSLSVLDHPPLLPVHGEDGPGGVHARAAMAIARRTAKPVRCVRIRRTRIPALVNKTHMHKRPAHHAPQCARHFTRPCIIGTECRQQIEC